LTLGAVCLDGCSVKLGSPKSLISFRADSDESDTEVEGNKVRTYSPKAHELSNEWLIIDATDVVLGRLATHAAALLRGKHKPTFAPHMDNGDFVIIINADKVALTGSKLAQKKAYRHSGYPGGLTATTYAELLEKTPEKAVEKAIRGMIPKNTLGRNQLAKLKVYRGAEHPHAAQQPKPFIISQVAQ
jgi:large subunit ribosomal protein L13